jgi:phage/plasmid primase-like uncharacterized protein
MIDRDQIRVELGVERVMDAFGLRGPIRNGWYRLALCPRCGEKSSREAVAIEASSGRWLHHGRERSAGGDCSGDLFDLVAACEGLDARKDFAKVLQRAGQLAGYSAHDPDLDRRVQARLIQIQAAEELDRLARLDAAASAAEHWDALAHRHPKGETYLTRRGLDPYALPVRYSNDGDVCVSLNSASGAVLSVATRLLEPGQRPKVLVRKGTTTKGTMVDAVSDIVHGRDVVLAEGLMDALTARVAWPRAVVLGANGAGNLAAVAKSAMPRIKLAGARLFLVPHDDEPGVRAMTAAGQIALAAGLQIGAQLRVIDLHEPDLNAAWCAGWRPTGADRCQ